MNAVFLTSSIYRFFFFYVLALKVQFANLYSDLPVYTVISIAIMHFVVFEEVCFAHSL